MDRLATPQRTPEPQAEARLPDFVIVGAMKSGTTALARWLNHHPECFLFPTKEVHFFDRDDNWRRGVDWYRSLFLDGRDAVAIGEGTPAYMYVPEAITRMAGVLPRARLIACLRNPVDRAYSHYWHRRHRREEKRSFGEAVEAEMAGDTDRFPGYLARGRYLTQLERLFAQYPEQAILVMLFDDLISEPTESFATVCRHVGLNPSMAPPLVGSRENTYKSYRAEWLYAAMFRYHLWRRLPRPIRPGVARAFVRSTDYAPMHPHLRVRLFEWYAEDNAALGRFLRRELPWT